MNTLLCLLFCIIILCFSGNHGAKTGCNYTIGAIGPWATPYGDFLTFAKFAAYLLNNNNDLYPDILPGVLPNVTLVVYPFSLFVVRYLQFILVDFSIFFNFYYLIVRCDTYDVGQTDPGLASVSAVKASEKSNFIAYLGGARTSQQQVC
jgi:hypothetical protein